MKKYEPIPLEEIRAAQRRIKDAIVRTPLVKLNVDDAPSEIYLKLENLQPIGSFKIRGASNAMKKAKPEELKDGVWTVSTGNHGQGVAWNARKLGIDCTIIAPKNADQAKIDAMERLGATIRKGPPFSSEHMEGFFDPNSYPDMKGLFIHPFNNPTVMAGQGTIGLEILEDLPDVDSVITPWGGGGLSCGVASAIRALKPDTKLYGSEPKTAAALAASFAADKAVEVDYIPSFIDSAGAALVWNEMWIRAKELLDGSLVVGIEETASAIRLLAERNKIIVEGAGALSVAAALTGKAGTGKVACIISGGSIDFDKLVKIFQGKIPE
jgi:threonine dehydratase